MPSKTSIGATFLIKVNRTIDRTMYSHFLNFLDGVEQDKSAQKLQLFTTTFRTNRHVLTTDAKFQRQS